MNVPTIVQARSKGVNTAWTNRYGEVVSLTNRQKELLSSFGLPIDFEDIIDEEYFAIDELIQEAKQYTTRRPGRFPSGRGSDCPALFNDFASSS